MKNVQFFFFSYIIYCYLNNQQFKNHEWENVVLIAKYVKSIITNLFIFIQRTYNTAHVDPSFRFLGIMVMSVLCKLLSKKGEVHHYPDTVCIVIVVQSLG